MSRRLVLRILRAAAIACSEWYRTAGTGPVLFMYPSHTLLYKQTVSLYWVYVQCFFALTFDETTLDLVGDRFIAKHDVIKNHCKPWTPWALKHLLEINYKNTAEPVKIILYTVLRESKPNLTEFADPVLQVHY